jgi:hypothetical protein
VGLGRAVGKHIWASDKNIAGFNPGLDSNLIICSITNNWFAGVNIMSPASPNVLQCVCRRRAKILAFPSPFYGFTMFLARHQLLHFIASLEYKTVLGSKKNILANAQKCCRLKQSTVGVNVATLFRLVSEKK